MKLRLVVLCNTVGCIHLRGNKIEISNNFYVLNSLKNILIIFLFRFLHSLKKKVKNKARVEGSICQAYLLEETALFCSHYFESYVQTQNRRVPRNDDGGVSVEHPPLSIFNHPGRPQGTCKNRFLTDEERIEIQRYVLLNCPLVDPIYR